jgi:hypothetical protein
LKIFLNLSKNESTVGITGAVGIVASGATTVGVTPNDLIVLSKVVSNIYLLK